METQLDLTLIIKHEDGADLPKMTMHAHFSPARYVVILVLACATALFGAYGIAREQWWAVYFSACCGVSTIWLEANGWKRLAREQQLALWTAIRGTASKMEKKRARS